MEKHLLNRDFVVRGIFTVYLISFIFRYFGGGFMHQFEAPILSYPSINITYWLFLLLKIPQFLTSNFFIALTADIILLGSCISLIIWPQKYYLAIIFTIGYWLNYMGYCLVNAYQASVYAPLLLCLPAMFKQGLNFSLCFWAVRLWACFLYFEAGFLKVLRGGIFHLDQMVNSIKLTLSLYLAQAPTESINLDLKYFLLSHPVFAQSLYIAATVLELTFLIGFFTRRYDWLLLSLFLLFHSTNQYILNMPFLSHQILFACCFINWKSLEVRINIFSLSLSKIKPEKY